MTDNAFDYWPMDDVEAVGDYKPGGYHPIKIGDTLQRARYTILSKLGHGGYSTVWMAHDNSQSRFVAVKIIKASSPSPSHEVEIRNVLRRAGNKHPGAKCVQQLLDAFAVQGPNGTHGCLVSEPGGFSVGDSKDSPRWIFPLEVARALSAQMVLATAFIHSHGIVHGDLHPGNWLLRIPFDVNSLTAEQYTAKYASYTEPMHRCDGRPLTASAPPYVAYRRGIGKACGNMALADAAIMLTDFGTAWRPAESTVYYLGTPCEFRPPECMIAESLSLPIGFGADVWTLAASIYHLFAEGYLLQGISASIDDAFAKCVGLIGRPPAAWWDAWARRDRFFSAAGEWQPRGPHGYPLSEPLANCMGVLREERRWFDDKAGVVFGDSELADLGAMLASMLRWDPKQRITAKKLAKGTWMTKWGLPAKRAVDAARST